MAARNGGCERGNIPTKQTLLRYLTDARALLRCHPLQRNLYRLLIV